MTKEQKKSLESQLWGIANTLRGKMNADEFKDYILGFIFYKYLSEKMHIYANNILSQDGIKYLSLEETTAEGQEILEAVKVEAVEALGYFLKPSELFHQIAMRGSRGEFILEELTSVLNAIEHSTMGTESEEDFEHLFDDIDLSSARLGKTENAKNTTITKVLSSLNEIDFSLTQAESDVLGDAYEFLISRFASSAGADAGEFYTPSNVSQILAKIATRGKTKIRSVYDPTCGSGSLLLRVQKEVGFVGDFFGQESSPTTCNLARMNMILHGVHYRNFDIQQDDTIENPMHIGKKFETIVANPPFSGRWSGSNLLSADDRFMAFGTLPSKSRADFMFVGHMLHHLADDGVMAVVLPHGALFRKEEKKIREYLIKESDYLDAVIGLPPNIFFGTKKPTCILVFKKCREENDIFFMDASSEEFYQRGDKQNYLTQQNVNRIVSQYFNRCEEEDVSKNISLDKLAENDFNLYIPRYTFKNKKVVTKPVASLVCAADRLERHILSVDAKFQRLCDNFNIPSPASSNLPLLQDYKDWFDNKVFTDGEKFLPLGDDGGWSNTNLENLLNETKKKSEGNETVHSVSVSLGLVDQVKHLGRSYAADSTDHYNRVETGDIVYTRSPTGDFPLGVVKQSMIPYSAIVSPLYGVFEPVSFNLGYIISVYFESPTRANNYLTPIVQKGVKNTISCNNQTFLNGYMNLPLGDTYTASVSQILFLLNQRIWLRNVDWETFENSGWSNLYEKFEIEL